MKKRQTALAVTGPPTNIEHCKAAQTVGVAEIIISRANVRPYDYI